MSHPTTQARPALRGSSNTATPGTARPAVSGPARLPLLPVADRFGRLSLV
jgi:hypothetical protein